MVIPGRKEPQCPTCAAACRTLGFLPPGNDHQQPTVTGRCETSSRVTTYEKCLQHAAFLGVDLVWTIEAVIASQPLHRRRGGKHAIGLTGRLEARGDV